MTTFTYLIVEPGNGELDIAPAPNPYEIGELIPPAKPELKGVAPMLYRLEHPVTQVPAVEALAELHREENRPPLVCCLLETDAATDAIRQHLAESLALKHPESGTAVFRYYDPRVFAHLHWILDDGQIGSLTGPVTSWTYLGETGNWVRIPMQGLASSPLEVTAEQFSQLGRLAFVRRALVPLKALLKDAMPEDLPRKLDEQFKKAERYGLPAEDRVPFALHGVLVASNFDQHPGIQAVLAAIDKVPYGEAVRNWPDKEWERIARESGQFLFE